jgi:hypothetical protein
MYGIETPEEICVTARALGKKVKKLNPVPITWMERIKQ